MEQVFKCKYCNKEYTSKLSKSCHEHFCKNNPNRRDISGKNNPRFGKSPPNKKQSTEKYKCYNGDVLDKTIAEINDYKEIHTHCEICGKKLNIKCIDHDHSNSTFRGILCLACNRSLGWYEHNKEKILEYLNKNK